MHHFAQSRTDQMSRPIIPEFVYKTNSCRKIFLPERRENLWPEFVNYKKTCRKIFLPERKENFWPEFFCSLLLFLFIFQSPAYFSIRLSLLDRLAFIKALLSLSNTNFEL